MHVKYIGLFALIALIGGAVTVAYGNSRYGTTAAAAPAQPERPARRYPHGWSEREREWQADAYAGTYRQPIEWGYCAMDEVIMPDYTYNRWMRFREESRDWEAHMEVLDTVMRVCGWTKP